MYAQENATPYMRHKQRPKITENRWSLEAVRMRSSTAPNTSYPERT